MEDRPSVPGEVTQDDTDIARRKKRSGFLSSFLLRRRGALPEESEFHHDIQSTEDNDSLIEKRKKKKLKKAWHTLFPSLVKVENEPGAPRNPDPKGFDIDTWMSWQAPNSEFQKKASGLTEMPEESHVNNEYMPAGHVTTNPEIPLNFETEIPLQDRDDLSPEQSHAEPMVREIPENQASVATEADVDTEIDAAGAVAQPEVAYQPVGFDTGRSVESSPVSLNAVSPQEYDRQASARNEIQVHANRGTAAPILLVGLEHLGRKKADEQIRQELGQRIDSLERTIDAGKRIEQRAPSQHVEYVASDQMPKTEVVGQRPAHEGRAQVSPEVPLEAAPARQDRSVTKEALIKEKPEVKIPATNRQESHISPELPNEEIKSEQIMREVASAAEQDVPVERVFERSHEVKDDLTGATGAASVGSVISGRPSPALAPIVATAVGSSHHQPDTDNGRVNVDQAEYQRAVKQGFWSAIVILIFGALAYLMVK